MDFKQYYVYILTSDNSKVLYTGVTNNLLKRVYEHKEKTIKGFTSKYNINRLVYYEVFENIEEAIKREKQIKGGSRNKKERLINKFNPRWEDLYSKF
jgi:putative endonuclease